MDAQAGSIFDGVPVAELAPELVGLRRRSFFPGQVLIAEGERRPPTILLIESGSAEAFMTDGDGSEHLLGIVGSGASLGEMAMMSGDPASATVRASTGVTVLEIDERSFHRLATRFPRIYLNLGIQLAERLARANRRTLPRRACPVTLTERHGGPPLAGYALACSIAWHTRQPVLALLIEEEHAEELTRLAERSPAPGVHERADGPAAGRARAEVATVAATGPFAPEVLPATIEGLRGRYSHIVVQVREGGAVGFGETVQLRLIGADAAAPDEGLSVRAWSRRAVSGPEHGDLLSVPSLNAAEEGAILGGMLPPHGDAGRVLGGLARRVSGLRVGLALGAGAMKGYAHIGVLRKLEELGVPIDCIAGTSIGAAVASLHAAGFSPERAADALDQMGALAFRPTVPRRSLLSSDALRDGLRRLAPETRIEDLPVPLAVVAADMVAHREVVFRRGPVWRAVLASMSIPGIYPPQQVGGALLVDGGVLNPVPASAVTGMGADVVLAVKLASPPSTSSAYSATARGPSVLQTIARTIEVMQTQITSFTTATATVLIEPSFSPGEGWGLRNFSLGRKYIPLGEDAVERARERIVGALPWVGGT